MKKIRSGLLLIMGGALALVACNGNGLTSTSIEVKEIKKDDSLELATKINLSIPSSGIISNLPKNDKELLAGELEFVYSDDVDAYYAFSSIRSYCYQDQKLTNRHLDFISTRKGIMTKYKSLTAMRSCERIYGEKHDITLSKSVMDFETGNLFYYQTNYIEENGNRSDKESIETKAIREGDKYIVASEIRVIDYDMPTDETITSEVAGMGTVTSQVTKKITDSRKVYTEIPSKYVVLDNDKQSKKVKYDLSKLVNDADYNLLFNIEEICTRIVMNTSVLSSTDVFANENWSSLYLENSNNKELHENYLLKGYSQDLGTIKYVYNFELNNEKALGDSININGYTKYDFDMTKATYSIFPLACEPYNISNNVSVSKDFLKTIFS